jgi:hypothetical protein
MKRKKQAARKGLKAAGYFIAGFASNKMCIVSEAHDVPPGKRERACHFVLQPI